MKVYKEKHHSGKELLERRKAKREAEQKEYETRIQEKGCENNMFPIRIYPASLFCDCKIHIP